MSLSLICNVPKRVPATDGLKMTEIAQFAKGATVEQLFVCEKSPLVATLETTSGVVPLFVNVTFSAAEVVPTFCAAKFNTFVESPTLVCPGETTTSRYATWLLVFVSASCTSPATDRS